MRRWFFDSLIALTGALFLISLSVILVLNFRLLYYRDVTRLQLTQEVSLTEEQIRENYDVLIDYNLVWKGIDRLEFPDFPMSEHGRIHFAEVRRIFVGLQFLTAGSFALLFIGLWVKIRGRDYLCLKLTAVMTLALPAALGVLVALNWEGVFTAFHHLMFSNDYWIFDPATDPVILILPDVFFLHCAEAILGCVLAGSAASWIAYRVLTKRNARKRIKGG